MYLIPLAFILVLNVDLFGQSYFNLLPDFGGIDNWGGGYDVDISDNIIYVYGHRKDTTYDGSDMKPILVQFDYEGAQKSLIPLRDSSYATPFNAIRFNHVNKNDSIWYCYSARFINSVSTAYLFELNINTGKIIRSILLPNLEFIEENSSPQGIYRNEENLYLLSYQQDADSVRLFITTIDTSFSEISQFRVKPMAAKQFPSYFKREINGSFTIIVDSRRTVKDKYSSYQSSLMRVDSQGAVLEFTWAPFYPPISNLLSLAQNVIQNETGDWIILGNQHEDKSDSCGNCFIGIPHIFSISENFDALIWKTRFFDIPEVVGPHYSSYSITKVADGYIGAGDYTKFDLEYFPSGGVLFKAGLNGDSLWMKHFLPLSWDGDRCQDARFIDIKTTKDDGIIIVGEIADLEIEARRPWILHLDKDGCLIPGCNTVDVKEPGEDQLAYFIIYPNPTSDEIYFFSSVDRSQKVMVKILSTDGIVIKSLSFLPQSYNQYIISVADLPAGNYFLTFSNADGSSMESHPFIKL